MLQLSAEALAIMPGMVRCVAQPRRRPTSLKKHACGGTTNHAQHGQASHGLLAIVSPSYPAWRLSEAVLNTRVWIVVTILFRHKCHTDGEDCAAASTDALVAMMHPGSPLLPP